MLQQGRPDNYVVGTGETPIQCASFVSLHSTMSDWITINMLLKIRCIIVQQKWMNWFLIEKAASVLGWEPTLNFRQLVQMMVDADMERLKPLVHH